MGMEDIWTQLFKSWYSLGSNPGPCGWKEEILLTVLTIRKLHNCSNLGIAWDQTQDLVVGRQTGLVLSTPPKFTFYQIFIKCNNLLYYISTEIYLFANHEIKFVSNMFPRFWLVIRCFFTCEKYRIANYSADTICFTSDKSHIKFSGLRSLLFVNNGFNQWLCRLLQDLLNF